MNENIFSFVAGVAATGIGFIFTMAWEINKQNSNKKSIEKLLLTLIKEEMKLNFKIIDNNINLPKNRKSNSFLFDHFNVETMMYLNSAFWPLLAYNLENININKINLDIISNLVVEVNHINENIRSRELFILMRNNITKEVNDVIYEYNDLIEQEMNDFYKKYLQLVDKIEDFKKPWKL